MERLSGLDASFLYLETPNQHMHVLAVIEFDPSTTPGGYSFERIKEMIASRLHLAAPLRRRLATVPFNIHHPIWVEDPDFDLDYHVRRVGCPAPGTKRELAELVDDIAGRKLDRNRPLWELVVVEGLEGGRVASIAKMHHCTIDGVSGANLMVRAVTRLARVKREQEGPGGAAPLTAPRTIYNAPITPHRQIAFADIALADVKGIKNRHGTTVNDVVQAVAAGAIRRHLAEYDSIPEKSLIAACPVSVRDGDDEGRGSNRVSALFSSLNTAIADPLKRLRAIHETNKGAKEEHHAIGAELLQNWAEFAAPTTFSLAARVYTGLRLAERHPVAINLVISNVPGPPIPLYFAGSKLTQLYPLGPIFDGAALNITVVSYMDRLFWGLIACRETVPGLWDLAAAIPESLQELKSAAVRKRRPARARKPVSRKKPVARARAAG
ncbi:MAG: wax ester/triacylglycerol synthase family O-acyltransferase [Actinobacteria bacterium]|nr:wax ester/triacylglycerol synthase family O-acyltransferase [Actinomycetota bacterium]